VSQKAVLVIVSPLHLTQFDDALVADGIPPEELVKRLMMKQIKNGRHPKSFFLPPSYDHHKPTSGDVRDAFLGPVGWQGQQW
jgi:hypothetical protein